MNIKQAKEFIKDTVKLYLKKDKFGDYRIPVVRQRPVFLLGAPGVGKTAIMEQIAEELGIALVSYSMTHHTRQSALGLPFIVNKTYGDKQFDVSEYTMSEIIASVYEVMENSGVKEGILFLDEINCVSETLAPSMLQFLQYKIFGKHAVPEGWVIVTAGNPPEYNKSVREFDVVTYDRLKLMEVEADYLVWKEYAQERRLHGAVVNYLDINKDDFYVIDTTVRGRGYVTARGWEDLSLIIQLYEEDNLSVDETLVGQYLRNDRIVREFTAYYELYKRYVSDYHIEDIMSGNIDSGVVERARNASYEEKLSIVGILSDRILGMVKDVMEEQETVLDIYKCLSAVKSSDKPVGEVLEAIYDARLNMIDKKSKAGAYSDKDKKKDKSVASFIYNLFRQNLCREDRDRDFDIVKNAFASRKQSLMEEVTRVQGGMDSAFDFCCEAFGEGNEVVLLLTELTASKSASSFIQAFGNERYIQLSSKLMIEDSTDKLLKKIGALDL